MGSPAAGDPRGPAPAVAGLIDEVRAWIAQDPDEAARAELEGLVEAATGTGEPAAEAVTDLRDRFDGTLEFGTAGLRGALGAGPNRMNRAVVIKAAAGLLAHLRTTVDEPTVVIGFDARHGSDVFARDTAAVVVAGGGRAMVLPEPLPTPVLAFAVRHLGADAGVMVTASHNPPQDNGYKVYLGDGRQIVPPADAEIAAQIDQVGPADEVPLARDGWETLGGDLLDAYVEQVAGLVSPGPRELSVVHTALHGVGTQTLRRVLTTAGFAEPVVVTSQAEPDPDFPTVAFPNPEEDGALDLALAQAEEVGADLLVANDPDADRCAVAVPAPEGGWRLLRGDELGAILGHHVLAQGVGADAAFACSIVSSRLLAALCAGAGVRHEETLTGFKWIARAEGLRYGYEEAIGYCVAPDVVADKDGISAALLVAELAAALRAQGRTLLDVLDDIETAHGVHGTDAFSVRVADLGQIEQVMQRLRAAPPEQVAGRAVSRLDDLATGDGGLPPTDGLRWYLDDGSRVIVRPSGTEPKLKVYLEAVVPVDGRDGLAAARDEARGTLAALRSDLQRLTAIDGTTTD
ncbi:phospho-sugar mutase [Janibacter alkaliphilus]|uniref:Phosphomannomutase n=1 Tax=Janibacter alkaliphilus TaxID=1069963 RepID=A0A852WYK4_9MICO|nr:phospho-sugar mutase [Janibacter alkaliphilus]NYG35689.1 phosphomannomutase [Janibacter alkaliphilus]